MPDLIVLSRFAASLVLAFVGGTLLLNWLTPGEHKIRAKLWAWFAFAAAALIGLQLILAAAAAAPDEGLFASGPLWVIASETLSGQVLLGRLMLTALIGLWFLTIRVSSPHFPLLLIVADLFFLPFSGHAATATPLTLSLATHGIHVAAALIWIGAVVGLALTARKAGAETEAFSGLHSTLRVFSPVALRLVVIVMLSGIIAGWLQIEPLAALFGTAYGQFLLVKTCIFLPIAIGAAGWLRCRYLPAFAGRSPHLALAIESLAGIAMIYTATHMSQSVPGREADIVWPLPFRLDWQLLWPNGEIDWLLTIQLVLSLALLAAAGTGAFYRQFARAGFAAALGLALGGVGLSGLAVQTYPTTYTTSTSE